MKIRPINTFCLSVACATTLLTLSGCNSSESKEAVPHTSPAKVQQARQENIDRIKNDPKIPAEAKAKALQYMGAGASAPQPLGASNDAANAPKK